MSFQISSLPKSHFEHLFSLSTDELASLLATRMTVTEKPGFPCRVSLADAEVGEEIILLNYQHQNADTPFQSSHAIFVRLNGVQATLKANEVPVVFHLRTLSLRAFDKAGMLIAADLTDGVALEIAIEKLFEEPRVAYIHIHYAKPGCYAARVDRT